VKREESFKDCPRRGQKNLWHFIKTRRGNKMGFRLRGRGSKGFNLGQRKIDPKKRTQRGFEGVSPSMVLGGGSRTDTAI